MSQILFDGGQIMFCNGQIVFTDDAANCQHCSSGNCQNPPSSTCASSPANLAVDASNAKHPTGGISSSDPCHCSTPGICGQTTATLSLENGFCDESPPTATWDSNDLVEVEGDGAAVNLTWGVDGPHFAVTLSYCTGPDIIYAKGGNSPVGTYYPICGQGYDDTDLGTVEVS